MPSDRPFIFLTSEDRPKGPSISIALSVTPETSDSVDEGVDASEVFPSGVEVDSDSVAFTPGSFKVLYIYSINDGKHDGRLKVGDATYHTSKSLEEVLAECDSDGELHTSVEIIDAAIARIDQQTLTADVEYKLEAAYLAIRPDLENPGRYVAFRDYDIHSVLIRSGFLKTFARKDKRSGEWFAATLDQVTAAVRSFQNGETALRSAQAVQITLREEQEAAVDATLKVFKRGTHDAPKEFLWNAIMRFGKTLTSYALIKKMDPEVKKVLIITHRPVVSSGWYEDFQKSFASNSGWSFGSKKFGNSWDTVKTTQKFVYFASIQDLRGSFGETLVIDENDESLSEIILNKNSELFSTDFDMCITDESHEGTRTELAEMMRDSIRSKYWLHLSGTPFNIIEDFDNENVFSWSYIDEQMASQKWIASKAQWDAAERNDTDVSSLTAYPGDVNPYGTLPKLEIRTLNVCDVFKNHPAVSANRTKFNFGKFFEVDRAALTIGKIYKDGFRPFVDVTAVDSLLRMIFKNDESGILDPETGNAVIDHRNFPFSRDSSKRDFAHTFWVLPSVESAVALHERLNEQFPEFFVVNATGDNDGGDALAAVKKAIKENERTITLSVGKLTTGTTIPEWTAVFMLSNMSSPMLYMQTIFRVKSSGSMSDGRVKETGYVFDFAPDRSLNMVVEAARATLSRIKEDGTKLDYAERKEQEREAIEAVLKYLPVIAYDGSRFEKADTDTLMRTLQRVYISQAVDSGFSHSKLYDFDIHGITPDDLKILEDVKTIVGKSSQDPAVKKLVISKSEMTEKEKKIVSEGKPPRDAPDENKKEWDEATKKLDLDRKNARKLVQILTGVSVRLPMLVFASAPGTRVTVDNLTELIDDASWEEFLPAGFAKTGDGVSWENLKKFYNRDVFDGACSEIQNRVKKMDGMSVLERTAAVANLFSTFQRPDKETILTPWHVVNRQYADTLGGLRFVDNDGAWYCKDSEGAAGVHSYRDYIDSQDTTNPLTIDPQWISVEEDLQKFWNNDYTTILDINSKTALYPLYGAISLWCRIRDQYLSSGGNLTAEIESEIWNEVVENQVFVNCRVPYSRKIAERALSGYKGTKVNASVIDVLQVRSVLKDAKLDKFTQNGDLAKGKRNLTEDEISDIWKWIFNPESIGTRTGDGTMTVADERARMVLGTAKDNVATESQIVEIDETEDVL